MKRIQLISILFTSLTIISCTAQQYSPQELPQTKIEWGAGGGFTGGSTTYILLENGQIFVFKNSKDNIQELNPIKETMARDLFIKAKQLNLDNFVNRPGNLYKFISFEDKNQENTITWGATDYQCPQKIIDFYNALEKARLKAIK